MRRALGGYRRGGWVVFLGLALAIFTWEMASAQTPIKIGASLSLTGTYAKPGSYKQEGYQLCAKDVNDKGGVLGRKIEFVIYDDQSEPRHRRAALREADHRGQGGRGDGAVLLGPITEAVANVSEKYKKVMVPPLAATTSIFGRGRKYIFMVISPAEVYLEGLVDMAAKRGLKTVAIINEDTLFPKAAAKGTVEMAKKKGMQVVFQEAYPKGNTDFSALLIKMKAANPDVIAAATYFDDAVAITRQMKELNVNPKMYGVTVGGDLPEFYDLLGQNAEYVYGSTQWEAESAATRARGVRRGLQEEVQPRAVLPLGRPDTRAAISTPRRQARRRAGLATRCASELLQAGDEDGLRRLQGGRGRLPDRPQDGACSSGRTARR